MEGMKEDIIFGVSEDLSEPVAKSAREGLSVRILIVNIQTMNTCSVGRKLQWD